MEQENELKLETTAFLQLLDLEDRRAELALDEPSLPDLEITYDLIETDIRATLQSIRDRRIARAVHKAGRTADLTLINNIAKVELRAQEGRERSLRLTRHSPPPSASLSSSSNSGSSNALSTTDSEPLDPGSPNSSVYDLPGPSKSSMNGDKVIYVPPILRLPAGRDAVECIICSDSTTEAYEAPCGCFYDRNCLTKLFTKATTDEPLFPPKCCSQSISFKEIRKILSPQLILTFERKTEEFSTPNRLYCSNKTCSKFLGPAAPTERDKSNIVCSDCSISTCSFCKSGTHATHIPCQNDAAAQQVLALGTQNRWMACPICHNLVERNGGCNHIVCRCGNEFCYGCGMRWGSCRHG